MKRNLYIATYSAHATILEKLATNLNAEIKKLYVSYGGFKAPKGSYDRSNHKKLFGGYQPSKNILHAKVILNDLGKDSSIWIWTGNLRKSTNTSQNILLSLPINSKNRKCVTQWFSNLPEEHLIVNVEKNGVESIETTSKLFNHLKDCINALDDEGLSAYVFSPWGSSKFLKDLSSLKKIKKINVYTRNVLSNCWVDFKNEKIGNRFIAKDLTPFPHMKCAFLTNDSGEVVWAYIGSANFTKAAMYENKNVECAAIFKDSVACEQIWDVFRELKAAKLWEKRKCGKSGDYDDSDKFDEDDWVGSTLDSTKGFEQRLLIRDAEIYFSKDNIQRKLERKYVAYKGEETFLPSCPFKFKITSIDEYYHLLVCRNNKKDDWVEVDVERKIEEEPPESILEASAGVTQLFNLVVFGTSGIDKSRDPKIPGDDDLPDESDGNLDKKRDFINIRFPIEKIAKNKKLKKEIYELAEKLKKTDMKILPEPDRKLLSNWLPLIECLKKESKK